MTRSLVLWCPDWPVVTALRSVGKPTNLPAAVFAANRVLACTAAARREGVAIGQRRREAQSRCPALEVLTADPERDARTFEPVAAVTEALAPGLEVLRPGLIGCPVRGPARYFGSEAKAAERIVDEVESLDIEARVGVADFLEVAVLAARQPALVPRGGSAAFCAPLPVSVLASEASIAGAGRAELVDLLIRLGIRTLGEFAAVPDVKVATRFGADAVAAHRLAKGLGERTVSRRRIPTDLTLEQICDPPLDRVDTAAFAARALAERFHTGLADAGLACTRLVIRARTERGKELERTWRCAAPLTPAATADRLRWQLDGWLHSSPGAITTLTLEPVEAIGAGHIQYGLWGSEGESDHRAGWALARVQGLLGPEAVLSPVAAGGRGPDEQVVLIPWGQEVPGPVEADATWPGRLPAPSPTRLAAGSRRLRIGLRDSAGHDITLTERGMLSAPPRWCVADADRRTAVLGWAGPWLLDERWWDAAAAPRCRARLQVQVADGAPLLIAFTGEHWMLEGVYD